MIEAERKYALAAGQQLPALAPTVRLGPSAEFDLTATYYGSRLRLTRAWQVIRHRTGGASGQHLSCPPLTSGWSCTTRAVTGAGSSAVAATLDGAAAPVAVLRTTVASSAARRGRAGAGCRSHG